MSKTDTPENKNLFDDLGVSIQESTVELGGTYPLYGMITQFISKQPGNVVVMINNQVEVRMSLDDLDKIDILSRRAFDPGIFVCTITQTSPNIKAECTTVVFGKNENAVQ